VDNFNAYTLTCVLKMPLLVLAPGVHSTPWDSQCKGLGPKYTFLLTLTKLLVDRDAMQLPKKYKENFDVSSEGPSSGSLLTLF
jgi:hypothetical protein